MKWGPVSLTTIQVNLQNCDPPAGSTGQVYGDTLQVPNLQTQASVNSEHVHLSHPSSPSR